MISTNLTISEFQRLNETFNHVLSWERAYGAAHLLFVFWIPTFIIAISYFMLIFMLNALSAPKKGMQIFFCKKRKKFLDKDSWCSMFSPYNKDIIKSIETDRGLFL
jgi:hypothetical protein